MTTGSFFHRATVERNTETNKDAHNQPLPPVWGAHLTLDCRVYNNKKTWVVDGDKDVSNTQLRIAYRIGEDVTVLDRITAITDRKATSLYAQTFAIKEPIRKGDHWEANLEEME